MEPRKYNHKRLRGASFPDRRVRDCLRACTLAACCFGVILEGTKMISIPFFHQKCVKWNTEGAAGGADGAPEMQPQAAAWSLVPHAPGVRLWDHLGRDENDFNPFFTPKMRKMEHGRWSRWSRWSHGNDATGCAAEPRSTRAGGQDYVSS